MQKCVLCTLDICTTVEEHVMPQWGHNSYEVASHVFTKVTSFYHLCVEYFSQLSIDRKSAAVADFVYFSDLNESCEKYSTQR